jgi:lysyl endopeptidase
MKKLVLSSLVLVLMVSSNLFGQTYMSAINKFELSMNIPIRSVEAPDRAQLANEDALRDRQGLLYRIGVARLTNVNTVNSGIWTTLPNGDRQWQLIVSAPGAEAISFLFETFKIYGATTLRIQNMKGQDVHALMTASDVQEHFRQNAALCFGDKLLLTLTEPKYTTPSEIDMDRIMYNYRSTGNPNAQKINESDACEVNVNCTPVGDPWQDEKRGVARIYVVEGAQAGWCSGTLINNTAADCKPYFLTALHCGVNSTTANMGQWKFYFRYEAPTCTNPTTGGSLASNFITGCLRIADSGDGGGNSGSDFLLVKLGTTSNETSVITQLKSTAFNAYWNGWNANTAATTGGASIHHPAGDIKKISTFTGNTVSTQWGSATGSHWRVTWTSNTNGYGVTEGGSSGSPLFNGSQGYVIGTLTGGGSFCTIQTAPDQYGKMSFHWTNNGTATNRQLKPWLDPTNSGLLLLAGSNDPCSVVVPTAPVANFVANQTNVAPATTVQFTDLSTGLPTSWAWSISPASGWAYAAGTSATSQNPQVTFNTVGQYTVTLIATNAQGNDSEIKNNYIVVAASTGPCTGSSATCDEFINTVTLNTLNNTSNCSTGGYANYTNISTSLAKGVSYSMTIVPGTPGQTNSAYTDDELAAWIDFNNNNSFSDPGEEVAYVLVGQGWSNTFNFTVPTTATIGNVRMRVRISYSPDGAIAPCGQSTYGEVEDYTINITTTSGLIENPLDGISVYPNPTDNELFVDMKNIDENVTSIEILDLSGKILQVVSANQATVVKMNTANLAQGMYQIRIVSDEYTLSKRFVKK